MEVQSKGRLADARICLIIMLSGFTVGVLLISLVLTRDSFVDTFAKPILVIGGQNMLGKELWKLSKVRNGLAWRIWDVRIEVRMLGHLVGTIFLFSLTFNAFLRE